MKIGEKIKAARKKAGLTQKELGEMLKIPYQQIGQYENGVRNPKIETLDKIASALGISTYDLVEFNEGYSQSDKKRMIKYLRQMSAGLNQIEMVDFTMSGLIYQLNDEGQEKAIELVELLTKIPEYKATITKSEEVIMKLDKDGNFINSEEDKPDE